MRVRFTATAIYETRGRNDGPVFEAGSVHDLPEAFAERWIRRGVAEIAPEPEPEPEPVRPAEPEPAPEPVRPVVPDIPRNRRGR